MFLVLFMGHWSFWAVFSVPLDGPLVLLGHVYGPFDEALVLLGHVSGPLDGPLVLFGHVSGS
jgi:hypothetical protein